MTGFNLYNPNTTPAPAPTFGATSTANTANTFFGSNTPTFGNAASTQNATFGSGTATGNISFGLPKTQNNVTFGTPTSTNITGGFGGVQPPTSFGTPTSQTALAFGTPGTQATSFGAAANQTNVGFGTPTTQTQSTFGALPSFGSIKPQTPTTSGGLFGATATGQSGLLGSGAPTTNTNVVKPTFGGGLSFPASTSAGQTGLSFGGFKPASTQPTTSTATQPSLFSIPTAAATTSAAAAPQTISFGLGSTPQSTSFGIGAPLSTSTATVQPTSTQGVVGGISFGATTTSAPLSFGNLGTTTATTLSATTTPGLLGPSFGATTTASSSGVFSWQKPASEAIATSTSVGLGGVDHTAVSTAQSTANTVVSAEEQALPNEIQQTVASFKEYVKTQKNLSSEVARTSAESLTKLTQQIGALNNLILTLGSILSQQKFTAEKIKLETIKSLNDYELAQKIKDSPVASEERMLAIRKYFIEKISAFEESTKTLQEKIEYVYQHVITLPQENSLSAEALKLIVKKLHDSFVVIGARAYKLHNDMQLLKVQYLTLRNQYVKDNSSISFSLNRELQLPFTDSRSKSNPADFTLEGPNPFSKTAGGSFNSLLLTSQNRNFPSSTTPSKDWGVSGFNTSKPFGFPDSSSIGFDQNSSFNVSSNQQFNLQKPPVGNKRGKR